MMTRKIRACEGDAAAQLLFERAIDDAVAKERARWKKADGYVCVMHPDDPMLKMLDGNLVFLQRTIPPFAESS